MNKFPVIKYLIFLGLLFWQGLLCAQNFSVKSFISAPDDMTARIISAVEDQNGEKCALIKIRTTQTGFVFEGDMLGIVKTVQEVGEVWLYVPAKARKLTIKHKDLGVLDNYIYPESISGACVYVMELVTAKITTIVEELETPMQWLTVSTDPDGADLYIENVYVGTTPYQQKMELGNYSYRIDKAMYHSSAGSILLSEEGVKALEVELKPNFGFVRITTIPENGATIEIDNLQVSGKTPYTSQQLRSGKHNATVKMVMYKPESIEFEITDETTTLLEIEMEANFAEVEIRTIDEGEIYIDEVRKARGTYVGRLMPGIHTFEVRHEKYHSDRKQMELLAGESRVLSLHPIPVTGRFDIITEPFGATIKINGEVMGQTPNTISDLLVGDYEIILEKQGYQTVRKSVSIVEGDNPPVNEILDKGVSEENFIFTDEEEVFPGEVDAAEDEEIYFIVEDMPTFRGKEPATEFRKYIAENLIYPEIAAKNGISGRVIVQFAINSRGKVVDEIVIRSVDPALDAEALRIVRTSPVWEPGHQRGKPVKVLFTFPISFVLQ